MDRYEEMRIFVRIAERRSFTLAADDLKLPRATVTNAIQRLEKRLGARLLERTTRQVTPTLDGEAHYQRCVRLLADMDEAEGAFRASAPTGMLRVDLQARLAREFVLPALPAFLERYPGIDIHIGEGDRLIDLVREGVDCVLRAGTLRDSSMVARRVALMEQVTLASPAYLARYGEPHSLGDLTAHRCVDFISSASGKPMPFDFVVDGEVRLIQLPSRVSVTGAEAYGAACISGLGIIQAPRYGVASELASGQLCVIMPHMPPQPLPVSVLYPQNRQLSPRVRVFTQWLTELFAPFNRGADTAILPMKV